MKAPGHRRERLEDQIHTEVAEMLAGELKDPRIGFATVTQVELSADYRHARILVSVLGSVDEQEATMAGLTSATGYVRREIGRRLRTRRAPEILFVLDRGPEEAQKIEELLHRVDPCE